MARLRACSKSPGRPGQGFGQWRSRAAQAGCRRCESDRLEGAPDHGMARVLLRCGPGRATLTFRAPFGLVPSALHPSYSQVALVKELLQVAVVDRLAELRVH